MSKTLGAPVPPAADESLVAVGATPPDLRPARLPRCGRSGCKCAVQVVAVVLAVVAAFISYLLLLEHMTGSAGPSWFDSVCRADSDTGTTATAAGEKKTYARDCDTVLKGDYGVWPPKKPGDPENVRRVPVAFLGLLYYSFLGIWFVGVGSPSRDRLWIHFFPLGMVTTGLAGSVFFTWIMFTHEEAWCPWCLVTHALNLALAGCLLLAWPPRQHSAAPAPAADAPVVTPSAPPGATAGDTAPAAPQLVPAACTLSWVRNHPSARQVLATLLALGLASYGHFALLGALSQRRLVLTAEANVRQLQQLVDRLKGDRNRMIARWQREDKRSITLRDDDPVQPFQHGEKTLQVVIFSDFQCPFCKQVSQFLAKEAQPLFDHHMRIVFKHYPLNPQCNANVKTAVHKMSCYTAALAEAARLQGGNDAFWKAHDYLFEHQQDTEKLSIDAFAQALGLDPERVKSDMRSEQAAHRIWEDVNEGKKCELRATPSVFVNGRYVESLMVRDLEFWDAVADQYWRTIGKPRPEHTKRPDLAGAGTDTTPPPEEAAPPSAGEGADTPADKPATPDTQGPPAGP